MKITVTKEIEFDEKEVAKTVLDNLDACGQFNYALQDALSECITNYGDFEEYFEKEYYDIYDTIFEIFKKSIDKA